MGQKGRQCYFITHQFSCEIIHETFPFNQTTFNLFIYCILSLQFSFLVGMKIFSMLYFPKIYFLVFRLFSFLFLFLMLVYTSKSFHFIVVSFPVLISLTVNQINFLVLNIQNQLYFKFFEISLIS